MEPTCRAALDGFPSPAVTRAESRLDASRQRHVLILRLERLMHELEERADGLVWTASQEDADLQLDFPNADPRDVRCSAANRASEAMRLRSMIQEVLEAAIDGYEHTGAHLPDRLVCAHLVADEFEQGLKSDLRPFAVARYQPTPSVPQDKRYFKAGRQGPPWRPRLGTNGWARARREPLPVETGMVSAHAVVYDRAFYAN